MARISDIPFSARFDRHVVKAASGCWLWIGGKDSDGYGIFSVAGSSRRAHRYAWEMSHGAIPHGAIVCHSCDIPSCVNPNHLFIGTHRDNRLDCVRKNRNGRGYRNPNTVKGDAHGRRVLSSAQVAQIRAIIATGTRTQSDIASEFLVSQTTISLIATAKHWKLLGPEVPRPKKVWTARGSRASRAILNEAQVRAIRTDYAAGGVSQAELGRRFGVSRGAVDSILSGKTWSHI